MPVAARSARRYAEAVFDIAVEQEALVQWAGDVQTIAAFAGEADVKRILDSARVPRDEKLRLLTAALQREISPAAMNLVRLLVQRDKIGLAPEIQRIFQEMADERAGIAHVVVTTAVPLSDDEKRTIVARLSTITGKQVDVRAVVDESIIGGVIARIGDQLIDASSRTKLIALKRSLEGAATR